MTPILHRVLLKPEVGEAKIGPETQILVSPSGTIYWYEGKWRITELTNHQNNS